MEAAEQAALWTAAARVAAASDREGKQEEEGSSSVTSTSSNEKMDETEAVVLGPQVEGEGMDTSGDSAGGGGAAACGDDTAMTELTEQLDSAPPLTPRTRAEENTQGGAGAGEQQLARRLTHSHRPHSPPRTLYLYSR
jgi:hypothetical protein